MNYEALSDMKLVTELLPDKVVYRLETTQTVAVGTTIGDYHEYTFPHGLPFTPLTLGTYTEDGFVTSYDYGVGPYGTLTLFAYDGFTLLAHVWADATNITIRCISFNSTRTITFRVIGLWPGPQVATGKYDIAIPMVQDKYLLNTDFNYLKHRSWFRIPITTNGLGTYVNAAYSTQLNYPVMTLAWLEEDGKISYGDTMNTINQSGVSLVTLSGANYYQLSVKSSLTKQVYVISKLYLDA